MAHFYALATLHQTADGWVPDLPAGRGFLMFATTSGAGGSAIGAYRLGYRLPKRAKATPAPRRLALLLQNAEGYPPALASAMLHMDQSTATTRAEFAAEFEVALDERLTRQRDGKPCLLKSRAGEIGYRDGGEYLWVVGYRPDQVGAEVAWLSSDYRVYTDGVAGFDVEPAWLAARFK